MRFLAVGSNMDEARWLYCAPIVDAVRANGLPAVYVDELASTPTTVLVPYRHPVTYDDFISDVVRVVEAVGAAIMVLGGLWALIAFVVAIAQPVTRGGAYQQLRMRLGRVILLGLEVLIIGDIVRTIVVDPTIESVAVLGLIVVIRIVLSFSLEVEMDGTWPWSRWRIAGGTKSPSTESD